MFYGSTNVKYTSIFKLVKNDLQHSLVNLINKFLKFYIFFFSIALNFFQGPIFQNSLESIFKKFGRFINKSFLVLILNQNL